MLFARSLLACATLTLIVPAVRAQELPSSLGAVQGTLLADTKQPILEASVWLQPVTTASPDDTLLGAEAANPSAVKTDPAGRFLLPKVKPGDYYVLFSAQGYVAPRDFVPPGALSTTKPLPAFVQQVTVTPGKTADVSLALEHGGAIEGTVRYADGRPGYQEPSSQPSNQAPGQNSGLAVALGVRRPNGTIARLVPTAHADATGHFRIPDVPPGSYLIFVPLGSGPQAATNTPQRSAQAPVFYGNTPDATRAKAAVVHANQTTSGIDITLP